MSDDLWGGLFDFNGDGKTSLDEEWIAFQIMEDATKNNQKYISGSAPKEKKQPPVIKPVPEEVNDFNYKHLCSEYRTECICAVLALIIMLIPAIIILWAVYSTYDPNNSANDFIAIVFTVAGILYGGAVIKEVVRSIKVSLENLELVKERYKK